jgi:hypothetical protein
LTPAQEFREARDWLAQHKRDPFLWIIVLMTLTMFTHNFGGNVILSSTFPSSDAKRAIGHVLPSADIRIVRTRPFCKSSRGTHIFGYEFGVKTDEGLENVGHICRDVVNGGWVLAFDNPKFKYLESR